jgi:GTP-binding protein Era
MNFKSGFAAIIGRPNSGKSTLLNNMLNEKVSIVTSKPQTTRNVIQGIYTDADHQIVFTDTPGIYKADNRLGQRMVKLAQETFQNVDVIIYIVDITKKDVHKGEGHIFESVKKAGKPVILVLNKTDMLKDKEMLLPIIKGFNDEFAFEAIYPVSAKNSEGVSFVLENVKKLMPKGDMLFDEENYTTQTERFLVSEIIREKLFISLDDEIPYGTHVEINSFKEREDKDIIDISADIYCEKKSHKAIIIGKKGEMLKKIGTQARLEIEHVLGTKVFLELWVRVKDEWRNDERFLKDIGFK